MALDPSGFGLLLILLQQEDGRGASVLRQSERDAPSTSGYSSRV